MEKTYCMDRSIDLMLAYDGTDSIICNALIYKDGMGECHYDTYV